MRRVLVALLVLGGVLNAFTPVPVANASGPPFAQFSRSIAEDSQGILHMVYFTSDDPLIQVSIPGVYYVRSTDGGLSWSAPQLVAQRIVRQTLMLPAIATDSRGFVHAVYNNAASPGQQVQDLFYTYFNGTTWSQSTRVTTDETRSAETWGVAATIGVDSGNNVHIAWSRYEGGFPLFDDDVYYRGFVNGHWTPPIALMDGDTPDNPTKSAHQPSIAIDSQDNVHVIWAVRLYDDPLPLGERLYYSENLQPATEVVPMRGVWASSLAGAASIAVSSDGVAHVIGSKFIANPGPYLEVLRVHYANNEGGQWNPSEDITELPSSGMRDSTGQPVFSLDESGGLNVFWMLFRRAGISPDVFLPTSIYHKERAGNQWLPKEKIYEGNGNLFMWTNAPYKTNGAKVVWANYWGDNVNTIMFWRSDSAKERVVRVSFAKATPALNSAYEQITAFSVSPTTVGTGEQFLLNVSVWAGGYTEYVAVFAKLNETDSKWVQITGWSATYINGTSDFAWYTNINETGTYTLRATTHTNTRPNCTDVKYTPKPFDGCGDWQDRTLVVTSRLRARARR